MLFILYKLLQYLPSNRLQDQLHVIQRYIRVYIHAYIHNQTARQGLANPYRKLENSKTSGVYQSAFRLSDIGLLNLVVEAFQIDYDSKYFAEYMKILISLFLNSCPIKRVITHPKLQVASYYIAFQLQSIKYR